MSSLKTKGEINLNDLIVKKSKFLQVLTRGGKIIIWHSLFGYPKIISKETLNFLEIFSNPKNIRQIVENEGLGEEDQGQIKELINSYYLIPENLDERNLINVKNAEREDLLIKGFFVDYLELIISEKCNFRCSYCIHFNNIENSNRKNNPKKIMNFITAKKAVDSYLMILKNSNKGVAMINFGGGEPLLGWSTIERTINYCLNSYNDFRFTFSINTNASLISESIAKKLKYYNIFIASSLDGLKESNDAVRLNNRKLGTFDVILKGFNNLSFINYPINGISVTLNSDNFYLFNEGFIDWAKKRGMTELRIDIDVIGMVDIDNEKIIEKLITIINYSEKNCINVAGFWSRPIENLNDSILETEVAFCGAVRGNSLCVNAIGDIYPCGYSNQKIGSIYAMGEMLKKNSDYCSFVKNRLIGVVESCNGCIIEGQCIGGCAITREFACVNKTTKIQKMCDFYQSMTKVLLLKD